VTSESLLSAWRILSGSLFVGCNFFSNFVSEVSDGSLMLLLVLMLLLLLLLLMVLRFSRDLEVGAVFGGLV
jgi:hypothetical protein